MSDMLRRVALMMQKSTVVTYATFDASNKASYVTLSGGNLTANLDCSAGAAGGVRSTISKATGKWYWELNSSFVVNYAYHGVGNASQTVLNYVGSSNYGLSYTNDGAIVGNGTVVSYTPDSYAAGDILGFALDVDALTLEVFKNNVSQGTYSTPAGPLFAFVSGGAFSNSNIVTANFGASAFTYSPPSGFNAGLYT